MLIKATLLCQPRLPGAWAARGTLWPPCQHRQWHSAEPTGRASLSACMVHPQWDLGRL